MKYLNNLNTGEVIRINKISDTGIYYTIYENKVYADQNLFGKDKRINIDNINDISFNNISGSFNDIKYEAAIRLLSTIETDYTLNEDEQNWNIPDGSETKTTLRITIPNNVYDKALMDRDKPNNNYFMLWQVIDYCQNGLSTITANCTYNAMVQYLEYINPEHLYVVEQYIDEGVVIEYKQ